MKLQNETLKAAMLFNVFGGWTNIVVNQGSRVLPYPGVGELPLYLPAVL
jgi:hypothetical protein